MTDRALPFAGIEIIGNLWKAHHMLIQAIKHLQTVHHHRNALYTTKTIQNEVIDVCGSIVHGTVLAKVHTACFFSIMVDEATDAGNDEQLTVSICYVKASNQTTEERFCLSVSV